MSNYLVIYIRGGMIERVLSTGTCSVVVVETSTCHATATQTHSLKLSRSMWIQVATRAIHSRFVA